MRSGGGLRLAAALALALAPGWARGDELSGRGIVTYQVFDTDVFRTDGLQESYDLRLQKMLLPVLQMNAGLRGSRNQGHADFGNGLVANSFSEVEPSGQLLYTLPRLQIQGAWDLLSTGSSNGILAGSRRRLERTVGRLLWSPQDLPRLNLQAERLKDEDETYGVRSGETILYGTLDYAWKKLTVSTSERYDRVDDGGNGFARKALETQGRLSYDDSFWSRKLEVSGSVLGSYTNLDERSTTQASVLVPTQVPIVQASNAVDDTPLDDRDRPLLPNAALRDGNLNASAGISVGPDGTPYQNIAVDLQRVVGIDELRIHVRDAAGRLVPVGGPIRWDVYASADGLSWAPIAGGARTFFDVPLSRYEVTFVNTPSRYFKVVGFLLNTVETYVTEIEAWYHTDVARGETKRTRMRLGNATASVVLQPVGPVRVSYYGLFNTVSQSPSDRPAFSSRDADHSVSVELFPTSALNFTARWEDRGVTQTGGYEQSLGGLSGTVRYTIGPRLDLSVQLLKSDEDNAGVTSTSSGVTFHSYARLLPAMDLSLDVGEQDQTFSVGQPDAHRFFLSAVSVWQVTDDLRTTLQGSVQRTDFALAPDGTYVPDTRDRRISADVFYRPSQQLALSARFGFASGAELAGLTQRYRVEWYPLPGGSVSIGGTYDEDVDPWSGRRSKRVMLDPRWTVNRHAVVNLNYSLYEVTGTFVSKTKIFYTNVTVTF